MTDPHFITACLYLLATIAAWAAVKRASGSAAFHEALHESVPKMLLWLALGCHAAALGASLLGSGPGINIGFSHAVSLIVWLTIVSYVVLGSDSRLTRLAVLYLAPAAVVAALTTLALPAQRIVVYGPEWPFRLHFVIALLAYALFTVAALHALLMLFVDKRLHAGAVADHLPPLLKVERLLFQSLTLAFLLLSATLVSGVAFSESLFGKAFQLSYKTVFAAISWGIFAGLLIGHWHFGVRGRIAARWTLIGFLLLLLSYVGSKFVLEIVLKRV